MQSALVNNFTCPKCSTKTDLYLSGALYLSCSSCGNSYSIDKDKNCEEVYMVKPTLQPIKTIDIGANGLYQNIPFHIIGHIRSINSNSISNEWLMKLEDGKELWLIENGFSYFVFQNEAITISPELVKGKSMGNRIEIQGYEYTIIDLSKQLEFQFDGQIPDNCFNKEPYFKYEAVSKDKTNLISICIFDKKIVEAFKGTYVDIKSLQISTLENFKDWI